MGGASGGDRRRRRRAKSRSVPLADTTNDVSAEQHERDDRDRDDEQSSDARPRRGSMTRHADADSTAIGNGDVLIAAITSCTNTSNPSVMIAAGIVAKKAAEKGMKVPPYVKTSLAPGSRVVTEYLEKTGLQTISRRDRLQSRRLRLHDLHRQFRSARSRRSRKRSSNTTSSRRRCFRAIAISRPAFIRTSRQIS